MMMPDSIEIPFHDATAADVDTRLEHLATVISGNAYLGSSEATLNNLRELYDSGNPASARFVENLLHCVVCSSHWRCEHCDYRQASRERSA
jgi:hypothetical protein